MLVSPPRRRSVAYVPNHTARTARPPHVQADKTTLLRCAVFLATMLSVALVLVVVVLHSTHQNNDRRSAGDKEWNISASSPDRPYFDLVVAVLVVGGVSKEALEEMSRVRRVYDRYGGKVVPSGKSTPLTFKVVFVVGRSSLPPDTDVPESGLLMGDFYFVDVREGYDHLSDKTKAIMGLSEHLR